MYNRYTTGGVYSTTVFLGDIFFLIRHSRKKVTFFSIRRFKANFPIRRDVEDRFWERSVEWSSNMYRRNIYQKELSIGQSYRRTAGLLIF